MAWCCCNPNGFFVGLQPTAEGCTSAGWCTVEADPGVTNCDTKCAQALCACCIEGATGNMECQTTDIVGNPWTLDACVAAGGEQKCPDTCVGDPCNLPPITNRPCCLPDGTCMVIDAQSCLAVEGEWYNELESCADVICETDQGCRPTQTPESIVNDSDIRFSLDQCEVAVLQLTKRNPEHVIPGQPPDDRQGTYAELVSTHEFRPVRVPAGAQPCRQSFGVLSKDLDGYVRPMLCSQPEFGDDQSRFNRGFFTKQQTDDIVDRVPRGYVHARVGVEQPVWSEIAVYHNWWRTGIFY